MSTQAAITVFDGAATPVSHTLQPIENKILPDGTQYALWREQLATLPVEAQISVEMRKRKLASGVVETRTRTNVPVMEAIAGQNAAGYTAAPKVAYVDSRESVTFQHPRCTSTSKNICYQISRNLANNVSTTVAAIAAGPEYELEVQQMMPT